MSDAHDITGGLDLLGDWLDARGYTEEAGLILRAMDFIHKQGEENARLREALKPFAEAADIYNLNDFSPSIDEEYTSFKIGLCRAAQAAMGEIDD